MSLLPQPATVSYTSSCGTITFNDPDLKTLSIECRPVPTADGRSTAYNIYSIQLSTIVTADNLSQSGVQNQGIVGGDGAALQRGTDNFFVVVRSVLSQQGGALTFSGQGVGPIVVNTPGNISLPRDVVWGPKPKLTRFVILAAQAAIDLIWTVEVAIPECCPSAKYDGAANWLQFVYDVTFNVDTSGLTTRTVSGFLQVPLGRLFPSDRTLRYSADDQRERMYPPPIAGYRRTPGPFKLSQDRTRIDFSVVDTQHPSNNFPPPGIVEVSASHTVTTNKSFGGIWNGTLNATYEIALNRERSSAFPCFFDLLGQKAAAAKAVKFKLDNLIDPNNKIGDKPAKDLINQQFVLIRALSMGEPEIYGKRGASFQAQYTFLSSLSDIGRASGLWKEVPSNSATKWVASMTFGKNNAWTARGFGAAAYARESDIIVDLCLPQEPRLPTMTPPPAQKLPPPAPPKPLSIPPGNSWLFYICWITFVDEDEVIELKPLQPSTGRDFTFTPPQGMIQDQTSTGFSSSQPLSPTRKLAVPDADIPVGPIGDPIGDKGQDPPSIIQRRAGPSRYVIFHGYAMRAGFPIPRPRLDTIGGVVPIPANREDNGFSHALIASYFGVGVYAASWSLRYILPSKPADNVRVPFNPLDGV